VSLFNGNLFDDNAGLGTIHNGFGMGELPAGAKPIAELLSLGARYALESSPRPSSATHFTMTSITPTELVVSYFSASGEPVGDGGIFLARDVGKSVRIIGEDGPVVPARSEDDGLLPSTGTGMPSWAPWAIAGGGLAVVGVAAYFLTRPKKVAANRRRRRTRRR